MYCLRYHRDPLVHGEEEPGASSEHEHCIGHFVTPCSAPAQKLERPILAASWLGYGTSSSIELRDRVSTASLPSGALVPSTMLRTWRFRAGTRYIDPVVCGKGGSHVMELARLGRVDVLGDAARYRDGGERGTLVSMSMGRVG